MWLKHGVMATFCFLFLPIQTETQNVQDCLNQPSLFHIFVCFRDFIILNGEITNLKRFLQTTPSKEQRDAYAGIVTDMLNNRRCPSNLPTSLSSSLSCLSPQLNGTSYHILYETTTTECSGVAEDGSCIESLGSPVFLHGWGAFGVGPGRSPLHLSAAHPISDGSVDLQAAELFQMTGAISVTVTGTRRDAFRNKTYSTCQDSTAADELYENENTPAVRLANQLHQTAPDWKVRLPSQSHCIMAATTNIFGRLLNGVPIGSECATPANASEATGSFIHIEQHQRFRDAVKPWSAALTAAFPPNGAEGSLRGLYLLVIFGVFGVFIGL